MTTAESGASHEIALELLLRRVAIGDRQAFADLFDRTYRTVESWMDASPAPAHHDDVLIEVYLRVWSTAASFVVGHTDVWRWIADLARPLLVPLPDPTPPRGRQGQQRAA